MTSRVREALERRLEKAPGDGRRQIVVHEVVGSTSSDLLARTRAGAPVGTVVAAERQTAGRGRVGRSWVSAQAGDLALSVSVGVSSADKVPLISLAAGVAACDAVRAAGLARAVLKWPNDILFSGLKLGGILCEAAQLAPRAIVVVGLGVNVGPRVFDEDLRGKATSLSQCGVTQARSEDLAVGFVENLELWIAKLDRRGPCDFVEAWQARAEPFGRLVRVGDVVGHTVGLDDGGRLKIQKKDGRIEQVAGGVVESVS